MQSTVTDILGEAGAIARRLGTAYEARPQQLEMANAVSDAMTVGQHLLVEAGTGVGKSFAYLIPAIDYAVRTKKRVIISTHTIALQEQLVEKDIPLIQSVYPDEFSAILVKGRGNYLCKRRLDQARGRQHMLFDQDAQLETLWAIENWANQSHEGSLASLPVLPDPSVWEKVNAEQGNCLGKRCRFYQECHWQAAKRRMQTGQLLIVNHALFFSDLALRMAGVNYLPKYDAVIFDEAHTLEDVAGQHFGIRLSEASVKYQLRSLYDQRRGAGVLSTHGGSANDAIRCVVELADIVDAFFDRIAWWQESHGRSNGRVHEPNIVPNDLTPRLNDLTKYLKEMIPKLGDNEESVSEITALANKVSGTAETIDVMISQAMPDAVYWFDIPKRGPRRVSMHAAPVDVAEGLRQQLFAKVPRVILTSATLATATEKPKGKSLKVNHGLEARATNVQSRGTGFQPVSDSTAINIRKGAYLPHWTRADAIYAITFRLGDSLPQEALAEKRQEVSGHDKNFSLNEWVENYLDSGAGACVLKKSEAASIVQEGLQQFDDERYRLIAWSVMPNHVHAVIQPLGKNELPAILHSWKSFSAKRINDLLKTSGTLWQPEYFDHLVRDERDLLNQVDYATANPQRANIPDWPWCGRNDDVIAELIGNTVKLEPSEPEHGLEARATNTHFPGMGLQPVNDPRFSFIQRRLGIDTARTLHLGSPFDYENQVILYIENDLPDPSDALRFTAAACEKILRYLDQTNGGAFVLFTSYKMLMDCANLLKDRIDRLRLPLLIQGQNVSRKMLLDQFRALDNAVLFGTSSFWQGIDVQGDKLRNVIIVKLPFAVPDEPLIEAKLEAIRRNGGNPFMDLQIPEAIIKLKQGFGRLIRSKSDTGIVVLLDGRVRTKRYGPLFLEALPRCRIIDVP